MSVRRVSGQLVYVLANAIVLAQQGLCISFSARPFDLARPGVASPLLPSFFGIYLDNS